MLENSNEFISLLLTVAEISKADGDDELFSLIQSSQAKIEETSYDNWNGGTYGYTVYFTIDVKTFISLKDRIDNIEQMLLDRFKIATRHLDNEGIDAIKLVPKTYSISAPIPDPHRPFSVAENNKREALSRYLDNTSEDNLIAEILLPLFRQLGFHRITSAEHKDKALEYGKDIWMRYTLPTQHIIYFGIQVKKGKLDSAGLTKGSNANIAEIYNQVLMMIGHEIFDPEIGKKVLVDHAFIVAGGEITKAAKNWLGGKLDTTKRSQIMFMDREDILNLFIVTNLPLPTSGTLSPSNADDLPF